jgi:hypothetical protein
MRFILNLVFGGLSLLLCSVLSGCMQPEAPVQKAPTPIPAVSSLPKADFLASVKEGRAPLSVTFTATSSGEITRWLWDFGDGKFSTVPSPQHLYSSVGEYTVSLAVNGPGGGDTKTKPGFIKVISDVINWKEAKNHIGQNKEIEGTIVSTHYATTVKGKPTFLNFNIPYTGYFCCVLWESDRAKFIKQFSLGPEVYFLNKHVLVRGVIEEYPKGSGVPEIELQEPSQIEVIEK